MGFRLEVQAYKIDPTDHKNVIFDQGGDLESYHNHQAWDYLPSHFYNSGRERSDGGSSRVRLEFDSAEDAQTGLAKLNQLKAKK